MKKKTQPTRIRREERKANLRDAGLSMYAEGSHLPNEEMLR